MTETEWKTGYAILRGGDLNGKRIDATDKVSIKYKLIDEDGETWIDVNRIVHVGPVEHSVTTPELAIFDTEAGEGTDVLPLVWFQPPPGAGRVGGYITITPGQEVHR